MSMRSDGCDWEVWVMPMIHEKRQLAACLEGRTIAGVIARGLNKELQDFLVELEVPLVAIRGSDSSDEDVSNGLHVDDEAIGGKAGAEFEHLNLDYWGFVHWQGVAWSEARLKSFQAYADFRGATNSILSLDASERQVWDGVTKIRDWLLELPKPCGILACNDEAGVDVLHACQLAELSVPDQVAVIGVDNDRLLCESAVPPLSSIDLQAGDVGKAAAMQLRSLLGHEEVESVHISQSSIVVRESSHEIDRYLLTYQKAMDFIASKAVSGISVAEVALSCGVSRRGVERAFEKYSSETPAGVIRQQRLAAILHLLKSQPLNLEHLAQQTGFSDPAGLSNFIKRMTGKPPGAFRQDH
ncbi:substrate-binding domain-containing protein [Verrucomicrobiaceae bacterium 5K15]|uniref:Substrate-binding domain-containing protein n=1 Tax=Oceaniferula flava TaxID=2800421 RepID=A0AAE2SBR8_9BACT|nr:substrate-binding domain-containing protein [Oceaniferula flavus]MBK1854019.1 substrate-binding domain-containing protein [Oceaniferula flavus]MBM1135325.1 substrate-binding domain-containing protein [Oceaniferula flavus]